MITKKALETSLKSGIMVLSLYDPSGDKRDIGVALFYNDSPRWAAMIEVIALKDWTTDQDYVLRYAEQGTKSFSSELSAGKLSNNAREMLVGHCRKHEKVIAAWCNGDKNAVLPPVFLRSEPRSNTVRGRYLPSSMPPLPERMPTNEEQIK